ncbi:unnamed protein product, partial [Didymodactylos carnosus]
VIPCPFCPITFTEIRNWRRHLSNQHPDKVLSDKERNASFASTIKRSEALSAESTEVSYAKLHVDLEDEPQRKLTAPSIEIYSNDLLHEHIVHSDTPEHRLKVYITKKKQRQVRRHHKSYYIPFTELLKEVLSLPEVKGYLSNASKSDSTILTDLSSGTFCRE